MKYIKLYGIQRSGTNFVQVLFRQNFVDVRVFDNTFGWKHGKPLTINGMEKWMDKKNRRQKLGDLFSKIRKNQCLYPCVIIKNPYSWYQSIKKWSSKYGGFHIERSYANYNKVYKSYKDLYEGKYKNEGIYCDAFILKYEDLLRNTKKKVTEVSNQFGINMKGKFIVPTKVYQSKTFTEQRKKFYLGNGNFGLSDKLIKRITDLIDWDLMKFYGYKRLIS